ncbi:hypothetical protein LTR62_005197 [Meristemomyces frigidus]|uniref:Uncharacterized protein n=1 Tax=Meristemomyces frigidus TaxID=1508187 RepID=A0AAN7TH52_9PEZI|nr:hypothetical protein LTR62_005197 [Meristemomyces frigidus]
MAPTTSNEQSEKALTPAQTAKPLGTAAKAAAANTPPPKAGATGSDSASEIAKQDTVKAIEKLEIKTKAVNTNNIARVANSQLTANDEKLQPFMSLKTGRPIEKFPSTSKDIAKLSCELDRLPLVRLNNLNFETDSNAVTTLDSILSALDADRSGNEEAKRERVRLQIGLKPHPA